MTRLTVRLQTGKVRVFDDVVEWDYLPCGRLTVRQTSDIGVSVLVYGLPVVECV